MKTALIAGSGLLPVESAKSIVARGEELVVITFTEQNALSFEAYAKDVITLGLGQVGKVLKYLKESGAKKLMFAGKIDKTLLEKNLKLDLKALWMLARLKDRQEDTLMLAIAREIEKLGIEIVSQLDYLSHLAVPNGVFSKKQPSKKQLDDVAFAFGKARGVAGLDIGQTVIVKNKTILAVESIEGTNQTISRGASFCNKGFTFMKVAKPMQDYRFDLPVIGLETLEFFAQNSGAVFCVESGSSLIIDQAACIEFANKHDFVLMSYKGTI